MGFCIGGGGKVSWWTAGWGRRAGLRDAVVVVVAEFVEYGGAGAAGAGAEGLDLDEAAVFGDGFVLLIGEEDEVALLNAGHSVVERAGQPEGEGDAAMGIRGDVDAPGYDLPAVDVDFEEDVSAW